jgi:hypothetical protein
MTQLIENKQQHHGLIAKKRAFFSGSFRRSKPADIGVARQSCRNWELETRIGILPLRGSELSRLLRPDSIGKLRHHPPKMSGAFAPFASPVLGVRWTPPES